MDNSDIEVPKDELSSRLEDPQIRIKLLNIIDRLDLIDDLLTRQDVVNQLQTNSMIERLAITLERATEAIDQISSPEMVSLLKEIRLGSTSLEKIVNFSKQFDGLGLGKNLLESTQLMKVFGEIVTDSMVERLMVQIERISNNIEELERLPINEIVLLVNAIKDAGLFETMPEVISGVVAVKRLMTDSLLERIMVVLDQGISYQNNLTSAIQMIPEAPPESIGLIGLYRLLKDPEVQKGLYYLITGLKALSVRRG